MEMTESKIDKGAFEKLLLHWREWIVSAVIGLGMILSFILVILPNASYILKDTREIKDNEETLEALTNKRQILERLAENASLEKEIVLIERVLPSFKPVIDALFSLDSQAQSMGLALSSYDLSPGEISTGSAETSSEQEAPKRVDGLQSFPMDITVSGNSASMSAFIQSVDTLAPLMLVKGAGLDQLQSFDSEEEEQQMSLELEVYFAEAPSSIGSVRSKVDTVEGEKLEVLNQLRSFSWFEPSDIELGEVPEGREDLFSFE